MSDDDLIAVTRQWAQAADNTQIEMVKACGSIDDDQAGTDVGRAELDGAMIDTIRLARISLAGLDKSLDMLAHALLDRKTRIHVNIGRIRDGLN